MLFKNYDQLIANGLTPALQKKRKDVLDILSAALESVDPYLLVERLFQGGQLVFESETIDLTCFDHIYLVGFGKACVGMAQAVCDSVSITKGIIITNDSSATLTGPVEVIVGGHPLPTRRSIDGAEKILQLFDECGENDCIIVLISGGGSALFCKPRIPLDDLIQTNNILLRSGANITEINTIRKHLSYVKGGQLVQHTKGVVIALLISDIVDNPIASIASGPTSPDPTTFSDSKEILKRYSLWKRVPASVRSVIEEGIAGVIPETLKEDNPAFDTVFNFLIGDNEFACRGAMKKAAELGYTVKLLTTSITGEARTIGRFLIDKIKHSVSPRKTVFITSGEPTVTVQGSGKGGRNQELVLSCVDEITGSEMVLASFATDGIDGNSDAAGALADGQTLNRAHQKNLNPSSFLHDNNSFGFFSELQDILCTGFTGTNVMDIQIIVI